MCKGTPEFPIVRSHALVYPAKLTGKTSNPQSEVAARFFSTQASQVFSTLAIRHEFNVISFMTNCMEGRADFISFARASFRRLTIATRSADPPVGKDTCFNEHSVLFLLSPNSKK